MAPDHYENFPVASWLLPAHLRPAVVALYRFARSADDLADEGEAPAGQRLAALSAYDEALTRLAACGPTQPPDWPALAPAEVFEPLRHAVHQYQLPIAPLRRLLQAFQQDVEGAPHPDALSLLDYCSRSANPVGELMLHLYQAHTAENLAWSDAICTGLQLTNFCQDLAIDLRRDRCYLPEDEVRAAGVSLRRLKTGELDPAARELIARQVRRARGWLCQGAPLATRIAGRAGWELRLVVLGGLRILERIERVNYDVFHQRPTLRKSDWLCLLTRLRWPPAGCTNPP